MPAWVETKVLGLREFMIAPHIVIIPNAITKLCSTKAWRLAIVKEEQGVKAG